MKTLYNSLFGNYDDLCKQAKIYEVECSKRTEWGKWKLESFTQDDGRPGAGLQIEGYEIDLTRIDSASKLGEWMFHLTEKGWITPKDLGDLAMAVRQLDICGKIKFKRDDSV
jgi:hypothetical protein